MSLSSSVTTPTLTERGDEGERQRHAGEVGEHAGAALDDRCSMPPGLPATTAAASQVPKTAPTSDVQSDRIRLFLNASLYGGRVERRVEVRRA